MLHHNTPYASIPVRDIEKARRFYEDIVGMKSVAVLDQSLLQYDSGDSKIFLYRSPLAGTLGVTVATWVIEHDIEGIIAQLGERGITFEHMDNENMPRLKRDGALHWVNNLKAAWFKDPDGNLLSLFQVVE